jgi:hypothetical protein
MKSPAMLAENRCATSAIWRGRRIIRRKRRPDTMFGCEPTPDTNSPSAPTQPGKSDGPDADSPVAADSRRIVVTGTCYLRCGSLEIVANDYEELRILLDDVIKSYAELTHFDFDGPGA